MNRYLLAIDAGTGSIRSVIFDLEGNQISSGQQEWTHKEDPRYPGSMDFDIKINYEIMLDCITSSISNAEISPESIIAISSASMREGIVLYDSEATEIWACANVDSRSSAEVTELAKISENFENEIYQKSGQTFSLGAIARILWVKNNLPDVYSKVACVTMLNDWINRKLTGILAVDPSNGCTTGMFDVNQRNWDADIALKCGIKPGIFPKVYESGTVLGNITEEVTEQTGLSTQCIVVTGGGDAQIGCVGVGAVKPGQAALFGGSFWQLEFNTDRAIIDPEGRVRVNCHSVPGIWQHEMIAFFPGLVMRWFRDAFCQLEKLVEKETDIDAYALLDKQAEKVPVGSYGLLSSFSCIQNYSSWKHGAPCFTNFSLDPEKFNKGTFFRSLLENAAMVTFGHLQILNKLNNIEIKDIVFASGASKSRVWCQIVADVLGVTLRVPKIKEAAALGTAFCAGVGAGIYKNIGDAVDRYVSIEKTYSPNMENHEKYQKIFVTWKKINMNQLENSDNGLLNHMWKAPGL